MCVIPLLSCYEFCFQLLESALAWYIVVMLMHGVIRDFSDVCQKVLTYVFDVFAAYQEVLTNISGVSAACQQARVQ